jgi:hypothetical protein
MRGKTGRPRCLCAASSKSLPSPTAPTKSRSASMPFNVSPRIARDVMAIFVESSQRETGSPCNSPSESAKFSSWWLGSDHRRDFGHPKNRNANRGVS